jgi:hypothetical protein
MPRLPSSLLIACLLAGVGFMLGVRMGRAPAAAAQDRGPPPPPPGVKPAPEKGAPPPLVYADDGGQTASGNGIIAVTGSYGVGTSVLYVLDTVNKQLAVYEARGGATSGRRLHLVGARRIDLDLKLEGYNDESDFTYGELRQRFERRETTADRDRARLRPAEEAAEHPIPVGGRDK